MALLDYGVGKRKLLLVLTNNDVSYVNSCASILGRYFGQVITHAGKVGTASELKLLAKLKGATHIATTSLSVLSLLDATLEGTESDNRGSVIELLDLKKENRIRCCLLPPLKWLFTVPHGAHLLERFSRKLAAGFVRKDAFKWRFLDYPEIDKIELTWDKALAIAVDIETGREHKHITSVAYTAAFAEGKAIKTDTVVIKIDSLSAVALMRRMNNLRPPKIMQNGQYDASYFLRYSAPLHNYLYDTFNFFHALYPELPRDLAFISSYFLDDFRYWKDEGSRNIYEYNAKDTHNTLWTFFAMLEYANSPETAYALSNYTRSFPLIFPCLQCGLEGLDVDEETRLKLREAEVQRKSAAKKSLEVMLGQPGFNPGSPKQVAEMMQAVGYNKAKGTDVKEMQKFLETDALYERLTRAIWNYREATKAVSTYFDVDLWHGKLLYKLDPSGTDSSRMASQASPFWCGTQVQNIPLYARKMVVAPEGWSFFAVDKAQSESYCTAYLSRDLNLLDAVNNSPDFHCHNASMFFGIPFEELFDAATGKKLRPDIRTIAKRVNHGANYNMGEGVLLETMGTKAVLEAKELLGLPSQWAPLRVCQYLLVCFDTAYPRIRDDWYKEVKREIATTGRLVTPDGWVRRTFLRPEKNKLELNSAVAHKPQCMSVQLVNRAFKKAWRELQYDKYRGKMRIKAQVHDEIMGIALDEVVEDVAEDLARLMEIPLEVGTRTMLIPSTIEIGKTWYDVKG